jgi:hypothetical protein
MAQQRRSRKVVGPVGPAAARGIHRGLPLLQDEVKNERAMTD